MLFTLEVVPCGVTLENSGPSACDVWPRLEGGQLPSRVTCRLPELNSHLGKMGGKGLLSSTPSVPATALLVPFLLEGGGCWL